MSGKYRKEKDCLNCGHQVEAHFCSYCGQENIIVKEDALHMVVHAVSDYFHFESKFFGTIKPLLLQPGVLTQKYVDGKRASYLHPIKLYIFISIVFFLVALGGNEERETEKKSAQPALEKDSLGNHKASTKKDVTKINVGGVDIIGTIKEENEKAEQDRSQAIAIKGNWKKDRDSTVEAYEKRQLSLPKEERNGYLVSKFKKQFIKVSYSRDAGNKAGKAVVHNIPKLMFLLLPLFALLLKLVYIDKKKYYFEHLIYSFHLHSAIFLAVLISTFVTWSIGYLYDISNFTTALCFFYIVWYLYKSLRTFYGNSKWLTGLKLLLLIICYSILMGFTFTIGFGISAAMI